MRGILWYPPYYTGRGGANVGALPTGTVTFLFTDIEGSTRLWEAHPEAMRAALARHDALLSAGIQQHGGQVVKSRGEGDSFFAVFARATDAVAAAVALQQTLLAEPWSPPANLRVRIAMHTGEADLRDGDYYGPAVNRCARLRAAAHGGQMLLSLATEQLVRGALPADAYLLDLGRHHLLDLTHPEHVYQLAHPALPADFPPLKSLNTRPNNLPAQPTPLIGREKEVAAACDLLQREEVRLVTLTGPGGSGKTRLGLQVAAELLDEFPDGVFFADLAPISNPDLALSIIAHILGLRENGDQPLAETVKAYLREKQLLLLLDNFEQVLPAAPLVAELLAAAPRLKVLVTSRAVLHLRAEHEFPVPPLPEPDAVEMFGLRAQAVKPDFAVTDETAPLVAEICRRLEGLPLAVELAAPRIRLFSPQALLSRLESRLKLLTGGARDLPARQQTLRDTLAWSYHLLDEEEKTLFRRLSVFVGGGTLEAAEAVCNAEGDLAIDLLEGLAALVSQSLVRQEEAAGEARFTMLETLREYGREQLAASGEEEALRRQHAQFFLALAETAEPEFRGARGKEWLERLKPEDANFWTALGWSREAREVDLGLRLGNALRDYWELWGRGEMAVELLVPLLELPEAAGRTLIRARALFTVGWFQDWVAGPKRLQESVAIYRELGDREGIAHALFHLGWIAMGQDDYATAIAYFDESQSLSRELGNKDRTSLALIRLSSLARAVGDYERARSFHEEGIALAREGQSSHTLAWALTLEGDEAFSQEDYDRAATLFREALALHRKAGNRVDAALLAALLGRVAYEQGDLTASRAYCEEGLALHGHPWLDVQLGRVAHREGDLAGAEALIKQGMDIFVRDRETSRILECLEALAGVFGSQRQPERAARLLGATAALRESFSTPMSPADRREYDRNLAAAQTQLGEAAFGAARAEGQTMSLEQAIQFALKEGADA